MESNLPAPVVVPRPNAVKSIYDNESSSWQGTDSQSGIEADEERSPQADVMSDADGTPFPDLRPAVPQVRVPRIRGQAVTITPAYQYGRVKYQERYEVVCPVHTNCRKSRGIAMDQGHFGPQGARLFLAAWLEGASSHRFNHNRAGHRKWRPSVSDITEFVLEHGEDQ